jgi:hypothetical protein
VTGGFPYIAEVKENSSAMEGLRIGLHRLRLAADLEVRTRANRGRMAREDRQNALAADNHVDEVMVRTCTSPLFHHW